MVTKNIVLFSFIIFSINLVGQIFPTELNQIFEDGVNDFFEKNTHKNYELTFYEGKGSETIENERISIKWLSGNSFQQTNYSLNDKRKLSKLFDKKLTNYNGYFADIVDSKLKNGTEIKKVGDKLYVKNYKDNILVVEKILTLDSNGKTIHQEHSYIDGNNKTTSFADFLEKKLSAIQVLQHVVYYKLINGKKVIEYESESVSTTQIDLKTNKHSISVKSKGRNKDMRESSSVIIYYKYFDKSGRLTKIEYPVFNKYMTIHYF